MSYLRTNKRGDPPDRKVFPCSTPTSGFAGPFWIPWQNPPATARPRSTHQRNSTARKDVQPKVVRKVPKELPKSTKKLSLESAREKATTSKPNRVASKMTEKPNGPAKSYSKQTDPSYFVVIGRPTASTLKSKSSAIPRYQHSKSTKPVGIGHDKSNANKDKVGTLESRLEKLENHLSLVEKSGIVGGKSTKSDEKLALKSAVDTLSQENASLKNQIRDMEISFSQEKRELENKVRQLEQQKNSLESAEKAKQYSSQKEIADLRDELKEMIHKLSAEKEVNKKLSKEVAFSKDENRKLELEKGRLDAELAASQNEIVNLKASLSEMNTASSWLQDQVESLNHDLFVEKETNDYLRREVAHSNAEKEELDASLREEETRRSQVESTVEQLQQEISIMKSNQDGTDYQLRQELARAKAANEEFQARLRSEETVRRQLHDKVQELKGNIRVFCRVRPAIPSDEVTSSTRETLHLSVVGDGLVQVKKFDRGSSSGKGASQVKFEFDRVFGPDSTQQQIFDEIAQLVQSAIDGYQVSIFAYGQTGSGKTFTMEGGPVGSGEEGMIPRSIRLVFETCESLKSTGWVFQCEASCLEIYNEQIRDLLGPSGGKHDIKLVNDEVIVTNLTTEIVTSEDELRDLIIRAQQQRAVAATRCNQHSSRSHFVLRLKLSGFNQVSHEKSVGMLHMIDLAGSERLKKSGATGDRLTETKNINQSLSSLGNVIRALSTKQKHIPYRDSKLTFLLQKALSPKAKLLMFANVSPTESCVDETLNSFRFAAQANKCSLGQAVKTKV